MKLTRDDIIKCFVDAGLTYEVVNLTEIPHPVKYHYDDALFIIKDNTNLVYFTDFKVEYNKGEFSSPYYKIEGKIFFVTPIGNLNDDIISVKTHYFVNSFNDIFIIRCDDPRIFDNINDMVLKTNIVSFKNTEIELL